MSKKVSVGARPAPGSLTSSSVIIESASLDEDRED